MILGLGEDIVSIERIGRLLNRGQERFLKRCYSEAEQEKALAIGNPNVRVAWLAKRFAAKEACAKALGTGISGGMNFYDIETLNEESGRPTIAVSGKCLERLQNLTPEGMNARLHVTLSDEPPMAKATVIIEAI